MSCIYYLTGTQTQTSWIFCLWFHKTNESVGLVKLLGQGPSGSYILVAFRCGIDALLFVGFQLRISLSFQEKFSFLSWGLPSCYSLNPLGKQGSLCLFFMPSSLSFKLFISSDHTTIQNIYIYRIISSSLNKVN